ncbi:hypothetical protein, partial [Actinomyces wuliandei]|uniref:hypothetical protein n=1 Tax=Actinomyces wuliandei TaxID=2057743 RepID=UPI001C55D9C5
MGQSTVRKMSTALCAALLLAGAVSAASAAPEAVTVSGETALSAGGVSVGVDKEDSDKDEAKKAKDKEGSDKDEAKKAKDKEGSDKDEAKKAKDKEDSDKDEAKKAKDKEDS